MRELHSRSRDLAPWRRPGRAAFGAILLIAAIGSSTCAAQGPPLAQQLIASVRAVDAASLAQIAQGRGTPEAEVAQGILAAFQGSDENAVEMLQMTAASSAIPPELRFEAWRTLADVHHRNGRFGAALNAWEAGLGLGLKQDALEAQAIAEAVATDRALAGIAPMQGEISRSAEIPIERNALRLPISLLFMNGQRQEVVLDPGAASSVVAETAARRLGLRLLDRTGQVLSNGNAGNPRFAVADTLKFAGADFQDVLFIVLADDALTFADGGGTVKIEAILGLPVMRRLGRLEFAITEAGERLRRRTTRAGNRASSNMILAGSQPVVVVNIEGTAAPLRMALDSRAIRSSLTRLGASEFPTLMASAISQESRNVGSGSATQIIPRMVLKVGEENVRLARIAVAGGPPCCHGVIGQDVLRSRAGYIIDFDAMRLELMSLSGAAPRNLRGR